MKFILFIIFCLVAPTTLVNAAPVTLEPITITTQKITEPSFNREADSKDEFYAEELQERGMTRLQDISKNVANFNITDQSLGSFRQMFTMRGLTNTSIFSAPAVVFYVDDVAYSSPITNMGQLFDIEALTVYRTAQPGRFGKNAYAGAVDIQTRQPDNILKSSVALDMGSYDYAAVNAKASGALIEDKLYFSLSGAYNGRDGFLYNSFLNNHPDTQENYSGRAALTWKPSTAWDVRLTLTKDDFNYGNARFTRLDQPTPFTTEAGLNEQLQQNADSQNLRIAHETDNYNLVSITSHRFWQMSPFIVDLDLKPLPIASRNLKNQDETWTQEVRLSPRKSGAWDWQLGGFFSTSQFLELDNIQTPGDLSKYWTDKHTENYAVFGRLAYQGISNLNLYTDLRLDYVSSHLDSWLDSTSGGFLAVKPSYDTVFASPKWGVDYRFSEHSLIYAATGFGFKPGGLTFANTEPRAIQFDRETSWQNSIGIKNDWFDERLKTNIAAFYYDITDYQVERFFAGGNYSAFNAPKVSSYGVEFESQAKIIDNLTLENSVGYTHIRFDDYHDRITGVDYTGNTAPFVPEYNTMTALQYKHPRGYFARAEWFWKGNTYFDETNLLHQSAYSVVNLRVGYAKGHYEAYVYANNLSDTYYYTTQLGVRGAPGDPTVAGVRLVLNY
ncbi:MAG: TonB-dependent receptor [Methylovulum sp.]|nr:TonB-dependent receptor [Methylovulum sp.]